MALPESELAKLLEPATAIAERSTEFKAEANDRSCGTSPAHSDSEYSSASVSEGGVNLQAGGESKPSESSCAPAPTSSSESDENEATAVAAKSAKIDSGKQDVPEPYVCASTTCLNRACQSDRPHAVIRLRVPSGQVICRQAAITT